MVFLMAASPAWAADVDATLDWVRRVELSTPVSGIVSEVLVEVGDRVAKGASLLRLDPRGFQARVVETEARLAREKENQEEAQRELERTDELYERTLIAEHEVQLARIELASAKARYQAAQARLTQARLDLEYSEVRAPFEGLVVRRAVALGQTVVTRLQGTPLLVLAEAGRMLARARVPVGEISRLQERQSLSVTVADHVYQGRIRHIALESESSPVAGGPLYAVDVEFPVPSNVILRAGQPASVTLP